MNIKSANKIKRIILELIIAGCIALIFYTIQTKFEIGDRNDVFVEMKAIVLEDDIFQIFCSESQAYSEEQSLKIPVKGNKDFQLIKMKMPASALNISFLRLDFGSKKQKIIINELSLKTEGKDYVWKGADIIRDFSCSAYLDKPILQNENAVYSINGMDPFIKTNKSIYNEYSRLLSASKKNQNINASILATIVFLFLFIYIHNWKSAKLEIQTDPQHQLKPKISTANKWILSSFMVFILLPGINFFSKIIPEATDHEKRVLHSEPIFKSKSFDRFTEEYTDFFNDHFGFRSLLIKLNSIYRVKLLQTSPQPSVVILGKQNWLFFSGGDLGIIANPFWPSSELDEIEKTLVERTLRLKEQGTDYYLLIAPEKSSVYPELMPDRFKNRNLNARMDQLFNRLKKNKLLKVIDVRQVLWKGKTKREVYYSTDTHWNVYGALLAYEQLIKTIKEDHPELIVHKADGYHYLNLVLEGGDLSEILNIPEIYTREEWIPFQKGKTGIYNDLLVKPVYNYSLNKTLNFTNPNKTNNLKLVLIHDSYSNFWLSSFQRDFSKSTFHWSNVYNSEVVEAAKPDVVVHEMVSRFTISLKIP